MMLQLTISKKQYKTLIKGLFIAEMVKTSYKPDEPDNSSKYSQLLSELLPHATAMELHHWIEEEDGKYFLTEDQEFKFYETLQEYEEFSFWSNLSTRLAQRDMEELYDDEAILKMSMGEELDKELEIEEKYEEEFEANGLSNLRLIKPEYN